MFVFLVLQ